MGYAFALQAKWKRRRLAAQGDLWDVEGLGHLDI